MSNREEGAVVAMLRVSVFAEAAVNVQVASEGNPVQL
jgi:hypothetical protein